MADIVKPGEGHIVALAMVNTILCGAWAALTFLIIHYLTQGKWTLLLTLNACLAGKLFPRTVVNFIFSLSCE